ncbi:MAG: pilus assembly protein [Chiayiivirga sp.]|jgi:type IV pilus assembly protein PilY1|uniref:pilus assembly protein n=1 Tax=Chiayiivirga sp. TaxID=2041042 RepID=UPI0025BCBDAB|nr:PilC/PilY family type IV pilus protein [Chiayiivirga sp.]MCI1730703.1 pilus assembly protein [Chiayiivirga sp.]
MNLIPAIRCLRAAAPKPRATLLGVALLTLCAGQAAAIDIPDVPLQSGAAYPPANVRFILDDSGSMEFYSMPADTSNRHDFAYVDDDGYERLADGLDDVIADRFYGSNTIFYDPRTTYKPWIKSDNTRYATGLGFGSAWDHPSLLTVPIDLATTKESVLYPKPSATDLTDQANFYRFQFRKVSGVDHVVRSEWFGTDRPSGFPTANLSDTSGTANNYANSVSVNVPANVTQLIVTLSGGSHGDNGPSYNNGNGSGANLYGGRDNDASNGGACAGADGINRDSGNSETCIIDDPASGTWYFGIVRGSRYRNVRMDVVFISEDSKGCDTSSRNKGWRNCTYATPTIPATPPATGTINRTEAQEITNFTTWYSYHSTRMKVAKAGASEAFSQLGATLRIGYDTIWNRSAFDIPVTSNNGVFSGSNRDTWFQRLHDANGSNSTPLQGALRRAGEYFKDDTATGPWGPESGTDQFTCRQSFAILTTDGYWNSNNNYGTGQKVGDADGTDGVEITDGVTGGRTYTYTPKRPYCDNLSGGSGATCGTSATDTLADVAMAYWKTDLRDLKNNVPTSSADEAFWQHMTTFGVSIGLQGTLDPKTELPSVTNGSKRWPDPTDTENAERIDDLWHASVNGRGSFIVASNAREFQRGLLDAFNSIAQRLGSASNVTANSTSFTTDTRVFQASYVSGRWHGELKAYNATSSGVAAVASWSASDRIAAVTPASRKIFTWGGAIDKGESFPTTAQLALLDQSARISAPATSAQNLAYLRGDQSREGADGLRIRDSLLGDVVNSSPFYVSATDTLYVGANDGMLHAFNADTGNELFAYVPGGVSAAELGKLSDPYYVHRYFVDGPVVVTSQRQTPGKSYLVGALGRGGKSLFGLDVTNPATFDDSKVLWEMDGTTDADLGFVLSEPLLAPLQDGTVAAIVGNGFNSTSGEAVLLVLDVTTGAVLHRIKTGATGDNGLSAPRGRDTNGDGKVDAVYAGDRLGNMWKFDFSGGTPIVAFGGDPMFTTPTGQPITTGLALGRDPTTNKAWIFFGTGSYLSKDDPADVSVQTIYGVIDESSATLTKSDLMQRKIFVTTTVNGTALRGFEPPSDLTAGKQGWYVDLDQPTPGERVTNRPQLVGTVLVFASIIPATDVSCDAGGSGYVNALDAFSGASTSERFFEHDTNGDGVVDDNDNLTDGSSQVPVGSIDLGVGMPTLPTIIDDLLVVGGSGGELGEASINPQGSVPRRASWQELEGN